MKNGLFSLDYKSLLDNVITAVFVAVIGGMGSVVLTQGFDVFTADWLAIGEKMVNIGVIAFVGDLIKTFVSTDNGKVFGKFGGVK